MSQQKASRLLISLAHEIRAIETRYDARKTAKGGRRIIDRLYEGNVALFQSTDRDKEVNLGTLAHLLGRSRTRVWALVAVAIVYDELPVDLRDQLSPAHHEALYGAADIERERLAREAIALGLTSDELAARVRGEILPDPVDPQPRDRSALAQLERAFDRLERDLARASPEERPEIRRRLATLAERIAAVLASPDPD